ncbi:MAG: ATP-dependent helicase [Nocardioides sp.]|nr:ATP-dependent helicase [Nocardioides sp.]
MSCVPAVALSAPTATVVVVSFVPLGGTAVFRPAEAPDPPREGVVEFSDDRRTVALPVRAAIPVLTKARTRDDLDPSLGLLAGAAMLGMRLVAAGRFEPHPEGASWRMAPLSAEDADKVRMLARAGEGDAHAHDDHAAEAERTVRLLLDAVADSVPRGAPPASRRTTSAAPGVPATTGRAGRPTGAPADPAFVDRLRERVERNKRRARAALLPQLVRISLRVEADEEELVAGSLRLVLQAHAEGDPLHVCDAARLFDDPDDLPADPSDPGHHGFGERARTHLLIALRGAAEAWPPLDRLAQLGVPDEISLDTDELVSLLDHGVAALRDRGVDVLWPRSLGRDLTSRQVLDRAEPDRGGPGEPGEPRGGRREEPLQDPVLGTSTLFGFRWQTALNGEPLTDEEMDALAAAASPVVRLRGGWAVVDPAVARKARQRLIRTLQPAEAVAAALTGELPAGATSPDEPLPAGAGPGGVQLGASLLKVRERLMAAATREPVPVPAGLAADLRGYQRQGLTWLADLTGLGLGACLADDMGLGKTITLISLHLHRREQGHIGPTLVVCPASLLGNWEAEVRRFAPAVPVRRHHGDRRVVAAPSDEGQGDLLAEDPPETDGASEEGFVLTTYGTMRRDAEALAGVGWDLVVADEAQHVKNPRSGTAKALRTIPSRARVALTGTPVENELTELWAILDWCTPGLLGSRNAFRKAWAMPIESGREPTRARQLADLIGPFVLRRRKSDPGVAPELPPKTETDHLVSLTREQVVLYEAFVRDMMERIERAAEQGEHARRGLVLALLTGLKQVCNHPAHFLKQSGATRLAGRSEKLDLLDELLATVLPEGGAVLVFTQYVAMARLLEQHLDATGVAHQTLDGSTPVAERERLVARFQEGPEQGAPPVFILSLKAGGTGLNLTRADHVVHFDRWWNPAVEEQATDRAYRIGQTRPVQVHRPITRGTVEERIGELLTRKRTLADAVLARGEAALTELGNEELRDLVTLRAEARRAAMASEAADDTDDLAGDTDDPAEDDA